VLLCLFFPCRMAAAAAPTQHGPAVMSMEARTAYQNLPAPVQAACSATYQEALVLPVNMQLCSRACNATVKQHQH
jgi:hypothetical protein